MAKFQQNISYKSYATFSEVDPLFLDYSKKHLTLYKKVVKSNIEKLLTNTLW